MLTVYVIRAFITHTHSVLVHIQFQYWYTFSSGTHSVLVHIQYWYTFSSGTHSVLVYIQ